MAECSTSDSIGISGTIVFGCIYVVILICTSVYSYRFLNKFDESFQNSSCFRKLKLFTFDIYKRRKCYIPVLTHLMDQITDISVVIQFGQLAATTVPSQCGGLNMNYLFILSVFTLLFYRVVSAFIIFQATKMLSRFILQFLDFELFRTLYINYLCDKANPCSPQRWITSLEAIFESSPQSLIQTIYLIKTGSFRNSPTVVFSLLFSLSSIIGKIVSDDRMISIDRAKNMQFKKDIASFKSFSCISWLYLARYFWRILDVSCRIFVSALLWLALGGWYLFLYVIVESIIFLTVSIKTKRYEYLFGLVSMTISKANKSAERITMNLLYYRISMNFIVMGFITFFTYVSIRNCWQCPTYQERQTFIVEDRTTFAIFIYCWCGILIIPLLSYFLYVAAFKGIKSNARTLSDMIKSNDYDGIIEMQVYMGHYGVFDTETDENLLMLCCQQKYGKLARHIFSFHGKVDPEARTKKNKCILDYLVGTDNVATTKKLNSLQRSNKKHLHQLIIDVGCKYPFLKSSTGATAIQMAFYLGNIKLAERLISNYCQFARAGHQTAAAQNESDKTNFLKRIEKSVVQLTLNIEDEVKENFDALQLQEMIGDVWQWAVKGDQPDSIEWIHEAANNDTVEMKIDWKIPRTAMEMDNIDFLKDMVLMKKTNILRALLAKMENINKTELWFYASNCNEENVELEIITLLALFMEDVNVQNDDGNTVLHIQCQKEEKHVNMAIIRYLREICDHSVKNKENRTAEECLKGVNLLFEHCENQVTVYVIQARNLPNPTVNKPDPYIMVKMNKSTFKTNTYFNELNPIWNTTFDEIGKNLFSSIDRIRFDLYYQVKLAKDDFIGGYTMRVCPNKDSVTAVQWVALKDANGKLVRNGNKQLCQLQIKMKYRENAKELNVRYYTHVMQLQILKGAVIGQWRPDPYVRVEWGAQSFQTQTISNTATPEWNSTAFVYAHDKYQRDFQLKLTLMDKDTVTADDLIGIGYVSADQIFKKCVDGEKVNVDVKLRKITANNERGLAFFNDEMDDNKFEVCGNLEIEMSLIHREQIESEFYNVLLNRFEKNNDRVLEKSEFESIFSDLKLAEDDSDAVGWWFDKFDQNKDKTIDENDVINMMSDRDFQASTLSARLISLYVGDDVRLLESLRRRKNVATSDVIYLKDRETGLLVREFIPQYVLNSLKLMYTTKLSRAVVQSKIGSTLVSAMGRNRGSSMDSAKSKQEIAAFIKQHNLDTKMLYREVSDFKTFNDFFARGIRVDEFRAVAYANDETVIVSPADCRLMAWHSINDATKIWIKGKNFTLENLIGAASNNIDVDKYNGGSFLISRLAPQDYHRWHYPISGQVQKIEKIGGTSHADSPIVVGKDIDVYTANKRVIIEIAISAQNIIASSMLMFVIGANNVGSFRFYKCDGADPVHDEPIPLQIGDQVKKGHLAGEFRYGGSTILLLFEPGNVKWDADILRHVDNNYETLIKVRERIGRIKRR